eukprot:915026-Pleurochrysis_carterae.AAC.1
MDTVYRCGGRRQWHGHCWPPQRGRAMSVRTHVYPCSISGAKAGSRVGIHVKSSSIQARMLTFAFGARPSLREWSERSGSASNPVELATHLLCGVE